jgi:hypothetical protein
MYSYQNFESFECIVAKVKVGIEVKDGIESYESIVTKVLKV